MSRLRIGLALGGGAARGWAHIGVLEALGEADIKPDIVCGSSIGALVGAAYVTGTLAPLEDWARAITWPKIVRLVDLRFSGGGLVGGGRIMKFLHELHGETSIEQLAKPFAAVATELTSGREIWMRNGSLTKAVRASIAMPGLLSPVKIGDRWLVDGGLVNPVPVSPCRALGAEIVIAVNLNGDVIHHPKAPRSGRGARARPRKARLDMIEDLMAGLPPALRNGVGAITTQLLGTGPDHPGYFDVVMRSIGIMQGYIMRSRMAGEPPDVMLAPRLNQIGLLEFNRADEAIEAGRVSVRRMLPTLRDVLEARQD